MSNMLLTFVCSTNEFIATKCKSKYVTSNCHLSGPGMKFSIEPFPKILLKISANFISSDYYLLTVIDTCTLAIVAKGGLYKSHTHSDQYDQNI